jgi:hypothetical protein
MLLNFFCRNYVAINITSVKILGKYAASGINYGQKSFIILAPVANVIKLFCHNYIAISITSVKILVKYAASGINYSQKSFILLGTSGQCY